MPSAAQSTPSSKHRTPKPTTFNKRIVQLVLIFAASVFIVDGLVGDRGLLAMWRARQQHEELAATIARQRADNARLREEAKRLRDDPRAIEELARRELGLIKPGEKVFIVKDVIPPQPKP